MERERVGSLWKWLLGGASFICVGILLAYSLVREPLSVSARLSNYAAIALHARVDTITLYISDNWLKMPDGQQIYVLGYSKNPNGRAQVPGPTLVVQQDDTVNITVVDASGKLGTVLPTLAAGLTTAPVQTVDGQRFSPPQGITMTAGPIIAAVSQQGKSAFYHFRAQHPGSYLYHQTIPQYTQMGMYGALIIEPVAGARLAYANTTPFDQAYTFVLSEMDSAAHQTEYSTLFQQHPAMDWTHYRADYFLINSKVWPDTMMDADDSINATVGQTVLVHLINAGSEIHMMHTHGFHFQVLGMDAQQLTFSYSKDTLLIPPGMSADILLQLDQVGRYMFHDHIEANTTNNGVYPGGMMTMINVNYPNGSNPVGMPPKNGNENGS